MRSKAGYRPKSAFPLLPLVANLDSQDIGYLFHAAPKIADQMRVQARHLYNHLETRVGTVSH